MPSAIAPNISFPDELGRDFLSRRSSEARRRLGAVYTPQPIVGSMIAWAKARARPSRIVDPGAGSGRFAIASALAFSEAEIIASEIDPEAAAILARNLRAFGLEDRVRI